MDLEKKKLLAQRALGVGKSRIIFVPERIEEIKQAITKQDIRMLNKEGAIIVRIIRGRKKRKNRKTKRSHGNVRKKINRMGEKYISMARKCRAYLQTLKTENKISREKYVTARKKIKMHSFSSLGQFKEYIGGAHDLTTKKKA